MFKGAETLSIIIKRLPSDSQFTFVQQRHSNSTINYLFVDVYIKDKGEFVVYGGFVGSVRLQVSHGTAISNTGSMCCCCQTLQLRCESIEMR